jgi:heat shock protein HtpX
MADVSFRASQSANKRKTYFLLASMGALVWLVVFAALTYFGKSTSAIVPIAVGIALISVWGSYYASDSIVLRMTGAREIQASDNQNLFNLIQEVTIASGLPMPKVPSSKTARQMPLRQVETPSTRSLRLPLESST